MIDHITFGQTHLIWPVVFGSGLLWLLFVWKEWTGETGPRFYIKILMGLIAVSALAMIALQPHIEKAQQISYTAVLSSGYKTTDVDSLKAAHKNLKILNYSPGMDLGNDIQTGQEVFVLGQGISSFDLWQLDKATVHFLAGSQPAGVSRLTYTRKNVAGNDFVVAGEYHAASKGQQLVLMGPGNSPLDSVQLEAAGSQRFSLRTPHLVAGKFVYTLVEKDSSGQELSSAPLAMTISAKDKLNILIINQFPSFETKYLKNFLAETGHGVMVRSQVSKGRYKYEYFNTEQRRTIDLTSKTLDETDLLIIDMSSLQKLSKSTRQVLESTIGEKGLGVFIQADESMYSLKIPLFNGSFVKQEDKEVTFETYPNSSLKKYPYIFKKEALLEPVQQSDAGITTAYKRSGAGRIGTTVLQNTYELILEGKEQAYQSFWSNTISAISKRKALEPQWKQGEMLVYQDAPFHFEVNTSRENPLVKTTEGVSIPLARDIDLKELWRGTTFPRKPGWNQLAMSDDSTAVFNFYVLDTSQWTSLRASKNMSENKRYFRQQDGNTVKTTSVKPMAPWWFFIAFLMAMSFLWLEPKLG
jgi:hypothetical protein